MMALEEGIGDILRVRENDGIVTCIKDEIVEFGGSL